jgi:hypothetical protein
MSEPAKTLHCRSCAATVDADLRLEAADWYGTWEAGSNRYPAGRLVYQCPACRPGGPMTKGKKR